MYILYFIIEIATGLHHMSCVEMLPALCTPHPIISHPAPTADPRVCMVVWTAIWCTGWYGVYGVQKWVTNWGVSGKTGTGYDRQILRRCWAKCFMCVYYNRMSNEMPYPNHPPAGPSNLLFQTPHIKYAAEGSVAAEMLKAQQAAKRLRAQQAAKMLRAPQAAQVKSTGGRRTRRRGARKSRRGKGKGKSRRRGRSKKKWGARITTLDLHVCSMRRQWKSPGASGTASCCKIRRRLCLWIWWLQWKYIPHIWLLQVDSATLLAQDKF